MSIFGKILKDFEEPIDEVIGLAKKTWFGISSVWYFLTHTGQLLTDAWDWMVNGASWLVHQTMHFAEQTGNAVWHIIEVTVPKAIEYAIGETWRFASHQITIAYDSLRGVIADLTNYVNKLTYKLAHEIEHEVLSVVKWVTKAVAWVEKYSVRVWWLLSHPEHIAKWIVGALAGPLLMTLLKLTAPVFGYLFHQWTRHSSDIAHLIEDILTRIA